MVEEATYPIQSLAAQLNSSFPITKPRFWQYDTPGLFASNQARFPCFLLHSCWGFEGGIALPVELEAEQLWQCSPGLWVLHLSIGYPLVGTVRFTNSTYPNVLA